MPRRLLLTTGTLAIASTGALLLALSRLHLEPVPPAITLDASEGRAPTSHVGPSPLPSLPTRMRIERIGLDAPLSVKTRDRTGLMQDPSGPEDIAWYDFTARPGEPGNAVFSGHVDYHDYGPAVFAHLRELQPGDAIDVFSADGSTHRYAVATRTSYAASEAPIDLIVGPTARASITLITCTGAFGGGEYSHRLVVRAEAV